MSDLIKRQDVLREIRAEIKNCENMNVKSSDDSLIRIIEQAEGYNSNEYFAMKILRELEKEAQHCDKIGMGLGVVVDMMAQFKKSEAYRYAQEIVVNILGELKSSDEWIPCEKELPPQPKANPIFGNRPVELYLVSDGFKDYPFRAFWDGKMFTNEFFKEDVIAWQPLPKPYNPTEN